MKTLPPIVNHLLYGDIHEAPTEILGIDTTRLDVEQSTRMQAAATVLLWLNGRLHVNGYEFLAGCHNPKFKVEPPKSGV